MTVDRYIYIYTLYIYIHTIYINISLTIYNIAIISSLLKVPKLKHLMDPAWSPEFEMWGTDHWHVETTLTPRWIRFCSFYPDFLYANPMSLISILICNLDLHSLQKLDLHKSHPGLFAPQNTPIPKFCLYTLWIHVRSKPTTLIFTFYSREIQSFPNHS